MATVIERQPAAPRRHDARNTVQWNASVAMAERQMRVAGLESLTVVDGSRTIGRIARRDIERCEHHGNWLDAVMVIHIVRNHHDTCN